MSRLDAYLLTSGKTEGQAPSILEVASNHAVDVILIVAAILFGAASLSFPFGHDQGVHYYIGREWLEHGALPYRDTFDYKTPGIYLLHAALIAVFGEGQWPIRLAELGCVAVLGRACAKLVAPNPARGFTGLCIFLTSVGYYGFFIYWDTAQCEIWCLTLAFVCLAIALRGSATLRVCAISGVVGGAALVMKPSVLGIVVLALVVLVTRTYPGGRSSGATMARFVGAFVGGVVALPALLLAYFLVKGGGDALREIIAADRAYVADTRAIRSAHDLWHASVSLFASFNPFASMLLGAVVLRVFIARASHTYRALRSLALPLATLIASYVGIVAQLKFYRYHCVLLVGPAVFLSGALLMDLLRHLRAATMKAAASIAAMVAMMFPLAAGAPRWWQSTADAVGLWTGALTRDEFNQKFVIPSLYYNYADSERLGCGSASTHAATKS